MKSIHTEIEINAPVERVWEVLMDFEAYPQWNPFITHLSGEKKEGGRLKVTIEMPGSKPMSFKPVCQVFKEKTEIKWLGHVLMPGIFDGEHCFRMKEIAPGKTKFVQSENFKGILLSMMWKNMHGKALNGFESMNQKLKQRAEEKA